jgi:Flp pilus assembly protein TadG
MEFVLRRGRFGSAVGRSMRVGPSPDLRGTSGQAMVEFALVLPILVTLMVAIVQFGIVFKNWINVTDAARMAARAAVVARFGGQTNCAAANAALDTALRPVGCHCNPSGSTGQCLATDDSVTVTVDTPWSVSLPLVPFSRGGQLTSTVTENLE